MKSHTIQKKIMILIALFALTLVSLAPSLVGAAAKDCKYHHGQSGYYGYGKTSSLTLERELMNSITVFFNDRNESYTRYAKSNNSQYCIVYTDKLNGRSGSHIVHYYVNSSLAHTSTNPWPFNFK